MPRHVPSLAALLLTLACGGPPSTTTPDEVVTLEEMRIVARGGDSGGHVFESYDAGQLFERGTSLLNEGQCREAVEQFYDRIPDEFPTSRYVGPSLYNAGLCLQQGNDAEAALPYFESLLERLPQSRDARHAAMQLLQINVQLERWDEGLALSDRVLLREDLTAPERLEVLARRAQVLLGQERIEDAERQARDALSYYRRQEQTGQVGDPYFAATANFVLAESMRLRAEAMDVPAGTAQEQHEVLDRRAQLLLDAQREYFDTIRHTNPELASAAGYRIGSMYDQLWHAMMRAPIPPATEPMNEATQAMYEEEYRAELARHIRPLLRHAIRYWELTLLMVERTGVQSDWTERTREDLDRMRSILLEQTDVQDPDETSEDPPADARTSMWRGLPSTVGTSSLNAAERQLAEVTPAPRAPARASAYALAR